MNDAPHIDRMSSKASGRCVISKAGFIPEILAKGKPSA
jgi:hypothetical protein